jgi:hypothetical protein
MLIVQFAALLASVGKEGKSATAPVAKSPAPATSASKPRPTMVANATRPTASQTATTLKRKADDGDAGARPKTLRTDSNPTISRTSLPAKASGPTTTRTVPAATAGYKGTARAVATPNPVKPQTTQNAPLKVVAGASSVSGNTTAPASASAPKKGGFAATLARAAAAQQANQVSGGLNIVHKPVEKLSRRERERQKQLQDAAQKQKQKGAVAKDKLAQQAGRSRSGTPGEMKPGSQPKKGPVQVGYSGTMRKPVEVGYTGTMRAKDPAKPVQPVKQKDKFGGQDKYGGYASWSDLSDAEEEEQDYMSDSDDMEGGFDDLEREEAATARLARREDLEAQAEEERLRKEKAERKKKLEAMAKQAQTKKRY